MTKITTWDDIPRFKPGERHKKKHLLYSGNLKLLPERCITVIFGKKGTGKSPFALALCDAISQGKPFLGIETRKRRVLYLDCENPSPILNQRVDYMKLKLDERWFRIWSAFEHPVPKIYAGKGGILTRIVRTSHEETGDPMLIVFDHWNQFFKPGESGLEPGQTNPMIATLKRLCGLGATILIIGHPLHSNDRRLYGWGDESMDAELLWEKTKSGTMTLTTQRSRLGEQCEFSIVSTREGRKETGFRLAKDRPVELMREYIRKNATLGKRALCEGAVKFFKSRGVKTNWNAVSKLLDKHNGKEWNSVTQQHGKQPYRLLEGGVQHKHKKKQPMRFPRETAQNPNH